MKKCISLLLTAALCLALAALLFGCEHEHEGDGNWHFDETHHWNYCTDKGCGAVVTKAVHNWNAGKVTTQPSATGDGVKTYTCTVCMQTKTEPIAYVPPASAEELAFQAAFAAENFTNLTATLTATTTADSVYKIELFTSENATLIHSYTQVGDSIQDSEKFYAVKDEGKPGYFRLFEIEGSSPFFREESIAQSDATVARLLQNYLENTAANLLTADFSAHFSAFTPANGAYYVENLALSQTLSYEAVRITLQEGRLAEMTIVEEGVTYLTTYTDYGTTTVLPPNELSGDTVSETQWAQLLALQDVQNYTLYCRVPTGATPSHNVYQFAADAGKLYQNSNGTERYFHFDGTRIYEYEQGANGFVRPETTASPTYADFETALAELRDNFLFPFTHLTDDYTTFSYDAVSGVYTADGISFTVQSMGEQTYYNATYMLRFENGALVGGSVTCYNAQQPSAQAKLTVKLTLGNASVTLPTT